MPVTDAPRRRLRLEQSELDALAALQTDDFEPWAREILGVLHSPALMMTIEFFTDPAIRYSVWAIPSIVVLGEPVADGAVELSTMEPVALPYVLSHLLGLRRRPKMDAAPIHVSVAEFDAIRERLASGERLDGQLVELVAAQRVTWRVSSVWANGDGQQPSHAVSVVDADHRGLWTVDGNGAQLTFQPVSAREAWHRITELLPKAEVTQ